MARPRKSNRGSKRKPRWGAILGVGSLLAALTMGGWIAWQTFHKAPKIRNVLLISIDTCRPDYLSCYGYSSKTTPNIDAIASEGVLFRNVISPVPMTLPAHCSMLTGTIPPYHGIHDNPEYGFADEEATLAEILKSRGFHTGGVVSTFVLSHRYGLDQGFDDYVDNMPPGPRGTPADERKGGDTTRLALDFLQRNVNNPFFLFLHYYDPHAPYAPPEPFASRFANSPYAGEIAYVDDCIGQVAAKLKDLGLFDSTLLVITSDHGEMLGEHGEMGHSFFIYEGGVKVVLIMRLPGQKGGRVVEEPVGLIDIVPTVCGLLRVKPPLHARGADLTPSLKGGKKGQAGRDYYCESLTPTKYGANSLLGLVRGNWKYIQTTRPELYDLEKDPREEKNLAPDRPDLSAGFQARLKSMLEKDTRARKGGKTSEWDPKAIASLAALGYVRGSVVEDFTFSTDKKDPKDLIGFHEAIFRVQRLINQRKFIEARKLCGDLLTQKPDFADTYFTLATISLYQGDLAGTLEALKKAAELNPEEYTYRKNLALTFEKLNRMDEAFQHFQKAEELEPRSAEVLAEHALALVRVRRLDEAAAKLRKALVLDPNSELSHRALAQVHLGRGEAGAAILECSKALEINPSNPETHNHLAEIYALTGDPRKALAHWADSLRLNPHQPDIASKALKLARETGDSAVQADIKTLTESANRAQNASTPAERQ